MCVYQCACVCVYVCALVCMCIRGVSPFRADRHLPDQKLPQKEEEEEEEG